MLQGYDGVSDRFNPVYVGDISWQEDPYHEKYWRFIFYSLRPLSNLVEAYNATGNQAYMERIIRITESFLNKGMESEYSWDKHTTAYRTMVLINIWWKLRENDVLTENMSTQILDALEKHGTFLAKNENYDHDDNHGVTEAAALYLLGYNFPDLENASIWQELGRQRLENSLTELVDTDGVLVENSPYYHFYVLRMYWDINQYAKANNLPISTQFQQKIEQMIQYGTFVLQPDSTIPTIGASLHAKVLNKEQFKEIGQNSPEFLYVISKSREGTKPVNRSLQFPTAGQTIMRSGWGESRPLENETYLYFDYGPYRTAHSDLDALSFHLFGNGQPILVDPGLFSYDLDKKGDTLKVLNHITPLSLTITTSPLVPERKDSLKKEISTPTNQPNIPCTQA